MRFSAIFFDWGDTLSPLDSNGVPILTTWASGLIHRLYHNSYRLAIISNTHRYQDGFWIRNELAKRNLLQYFEVIFSSATYAIHKPDTRAFQQALDFMKLDPRKVLMVGDSEHCDGACQFLRMKYMKVTPGENWSERLYNKLHDPGVDQGRINRLLSNLYEYSLEGDSLVVKVRHLSEPFRVNDKVLLDQKEYRVTRIPRLMTKDEILKAKDEFVEFGVERVDPT